LLQPNAEAEIAFVLRDDLSGEDLSPGRVRAAVDYAVAALEIVDSRIADWDITIADTIADNASSGLFVLGDTSLALSGPSHVSPPHHIGVNYSWPTVTYRNMMQPQRAFVNNDEMVIKSDGRPDGNQLVARNVRRLRLERAMSLGELARRSGLSKQTLSKIEQGVGNPTVETLSLLGAALAVPARRLLTETGTPVFVQRHDEGIWAEAAAWSERILDETFGSGYVRTLVLRLVRSPREPAVIQPHAPGTLHHLYVISGRLRTGPVNDPVELGAGDFVRFPGDIEHRHVCLSERVAAHMVTTVPQVRQFGPTVIRGGA
jgi:transcriptional regulator with XRE-family HTH domain